MVKLKLFFFGLVGLYFLLLTYVLVVGWLLTSPVRQLADHLKTASQSLQQKDLNQIETSLQSAAVELTRLESGYRFVSWVRFMPLYGPYIADAGHGLKASRSGLEAGQIIIEAIKPYADVLGFSASDVKLNIESAEEKILFILDTLDKISPQLDSVGQKVSEIETELSRINPKRYPVSFRGRPVRSQLVSLQQSLAATKDSLANIKPLLILLPKLLGQEKPQKYLLLFQNDAELRPTGGFLTAYAILETFKAKITPQLSDDIYRLDQRFGNRLPAPEPIKKYLPLVFNWHLRDMNLSPDFKVSMETFFPNYQAVALVKDVDGIIAIDTQLVVDLLKVLGEVGVAEWGRYNAEIVPECNCPQVVYKMEDYATRPTYYIKENRKGMIGPLMHAILLHVMNSPKKLWPQFVEIGLRNIKAKHLLFYFPDDEAMQTLAESFQAAGRIVDYDDDYFNLNDTNFAGAKSNLYITQTIDQEIEIAADGTVTKTVTIEYVNPEPPDDCNLESGDLCLNGLLRDWVRLYVPEGSQLVEVLGSDIPATTSKDLGKTVLEAFIELRPQSKAKLIFKYTLPFKLQFGQSYKMLIQKQPGTKNHRYTVTLGNRSEEFDLDGDRELSL